MTKYNFTIKDNHDGWSWVDDINSALQIINQEISAQFTSNNDANIAQLYEQSTALVRLKWSIIAAINNPNAITRHPTSIPLTSSDVMTLTTAMPALGVAIHKHQSHGDHTASH